MTTPQDFVKSISSWSVKDVMHAVELLKEEFGISDMALAPQAAAPASGSCPLSSRRCLSSLSPYRE